MSETPTLTERIRAYLSQLDAHKHNSEFAGLLREAVEEIEKLEKNKDDLWEAMNYLIYGRGKNMNSTIYQRDEKLRELFDKITICSPKVAIEVAAAVLELEKKNAELQSKLGVALEDKEKAEEALKTSRELREATQAENAGLREVVEFTIGQLWKEQNDFDDCPTSEFKEWIKKLEASISGQSTNALLEELKQLRKRVKELEQENEKWKRQLKLLRMENAVMKDSLKSAYDAFYHNGNEEWPSAKKVKKVLDGIKQKQ